MIPHKECVSSRAKQFLAKSGPMATLSRPAGFPEAQERVLQSAGQLQRPCRQDRKSREGPSERWPANGHFYQRGSSQGASPLGLSHGWQIPYYPTQRIYQRPGQAIFSEKRPDGHFIKASWLPGSPKEGPSERWPAPTAVLSRPEAQERALPSAGRPMAIFINAEAAKGPAP